MIIAAAGGRPTSVEKEKSQGVIGSC